MATLVATWRRNRCREMMVWSKRIAEDNLNPETAKQQTTETKWNRDRTNCGPIGISSFGQQLDGDKQV
jgi:hypothetical protein